MIDSIFFQLKFRMKYMPFSITLQLYSLYKVKKTYYKTVIECTIVPEYMYMRYFFTNVTCRQKKIRGLARTGYNFFFVNIKRPLFLYVMNARTRFVNPVCILIKCF